MTNQEELGNQVRDIVRCATVEASETSNKLSQLASEQAFHDCSKELEQSKLLVGGTDKVLL